MLFTDNKYNLSATKSVFNLIHKVNVFKFNKPDACGSLNKTISTDGITYPAQHKQLHFLNSILKSIIENPESTAPFHSLLMEIENLTQAAVSALYITKASGEHELLSVTNAAAQDALHEYLGYVSVDEKYNAISINKHNDDKLFVIKIIRLDDASRNTNGILLLKIPKSISNNISIEELESIKLALSGILASSQHLDSSKHIALHEERALIARELHDSLAQSLSYLKIQVSRLQSILKTDSEVNKSMFVAASGIVEELRANLNISYKQLRELITTFRLALNSRDLAHALEDSVEEFENRSGVAISIDNRLSGTSLAVDEEIHILQIIREAISNVIRHSRASRAEIKLITLDQNQIEITIDDDGIGMKNKQINAHRHGMIIMQQRAHDLGGKLRVQSSNLGGAHVKVTFVSKKSKKTL